MFSSVVWFQSSLEPLDQCVWLVEVVLRCVNPPFSD